MEGEMKLNWNNLVSIAANVGIIVGLVLVALQLRQNAALARVQILSQDISDERAVEIGMFGDAGAIAWAKSIESPGTMNSAEVKVVDGWLVNQVQGWLRVQLLELEGLVPSGSTEARIRNVVDFYFGNRFAKAWWKYESQRGYDPALVELVDSALRRIDDDSNRHWLNDLRSDVSDAGGAGSVAPPGEVQKR
jgi:hypothetical protein